MSKAHKEGGDLVSSERLASAFMSLGIADISKKSKTVPGAPVAPVSIANSRKRRSYILLL